VVEIEGATRNRAGLEAAAAATIAAMQTGAPVIYQAAFLCDGWVGYADFLERVELPSTLGEWSYEVVDAKLARNVRALALVQLCDYSQQVARIQDRVPEHIHVVTGDRVRHSFRLADYAAYHRTLKARFLARPKPALPRRRIPIRSITATSVDGGRRAATADGNDDHLSLVAGWAGASASASSGQASSAGARRQWPDELPRSGINASTYEKLHLQARCSCAVKGPHLPCTSCCGPRPSTMLSARAVSPHSRHRRPATCSSTSKAIRTRSMAASSTCSESPKSPATRPSTTSSGLTLAARNGRRSNARSI